jgi:hypothetical protein
LVAEDAGAWAGHGPGAALFALCAAGLAVLLARLRGCRTVCIDTALDVRATGQWQNTIGCISRPQRLTVGVTEGQTPAHLLRTVGAALAQVQQQRQVAPAGEHPAACRALLQLDDVTFPPFGEFAVKVERLDTCYSLRKTRAPELEPVVCLAIDSYNSPDNLKAAFTLCDGHLPNGRVPELAQAYLRLLDALIAAREQPL